jgi:hypothetical protein|tara:strand:- start:2717 stop:2962 length:246 start_codon:yes stop_codon:yes gene_type:complete
LHQHQQLTRVRYKKERQNQHILSTSVCTKNLEISLFFERLSKNTITFFRAKTLSFVVSFFLSKDKNHHASSDFIVDDGAKE